MPADDNDGEDLRRNLARLLWRSKLAAGSDPESRRASWAAERREYLAQAGKMLRLMDQEKLSIGLVAEKPVALETDSEYGQ